MGQLRATLLVVSSFWSRGQCHNEPGAKTDGAACSQRAAHRPMGMDMEVSRVLGLICSTLPGFEGSFVPRPGEEAVVLFSAPSENL